MISHLISWCGFLALKSGIREVQTNHKSRPISFFQVVGISYKHQVGGNNQLTLFRRPAAFSSSFRYSPEKEPPIAKCNMLVHSKTGCVEVASCPALSNLTEPLGASPCSQQVRPLHLSVSSLYAMPLLLRRSAPSPSVEQLAFSVPVAPLSSSIASSTGSSSGASGLRASGGHEAHLAQLQRCSTHARMSMARRQSTASSSHTDLACMFETCENSECTDPQHLQALQLRQSSGEYDGSSSSDGQRESGIRASKKLSSDDQLDDEDTATSEWGYGSETGRPSSVPSCSCSCREDDAHITASNVTIEDKQLAVVDKELRDLRKTFANKLYTRLSKMSKTFGRKRGGSTPQLSVS